MNLSTCLSIYEPIYLPDYLLTYLPTCLSMNLSTYLSIYEPIYLPVYQGAADDPSSAADCAHVHRMSELQDHPRHL